MGEYNQTNPNRTFVIARYNEPDISLQLPEGEITTIQKDQDIPNLGRESSSWLLYILNNYTDLPDYITFLQGDPFPHATNFDYHGDYTRHGALLECDLNGNPHHGSLNLRNALTIMNLPHPPSVPFCMGAQFTVSKERIQTYPYHLYANLFAYSVSNPNAPWELERLWETFFA